MPLAVMVVEAEVAVAVLVTTFHPTGGGWYTYGRAGVGKDWGGGYRPFGKIANHPL